MAAFRTAKVCLRQMSFSTFCRGFLEVISCIFGVFHSKKWITSVEKWINGYKTADRSHSCGVGGERKSLQEMSVDFIYEWVGVVWLDSTQKIDQIAFRALICLCRKRAAQSFLVVVCGRSRGDASNVGESP